MMKSKRAVFLLLVIAAGLVLVGVALPGPARAAPPALPPRPTLTPIPPTAPPTVVPTPVPTGLRPTDPPETPAPTLAPGEPTPLPAAPAAVLPAAGVAGPAWPGLLLGTGLVLLGVMGLILMGAGRRRR